MEKHTDIAAIERATLAAVPPEAQEERAGWLLAYDGGTVGRSHSGVPLAHDETTAAAWPQVVAAYRAHGRRPVLRLPAVPAFEAQHAALQAQGLAPTQPTLVKTTALSQFHVYRPREDVRLADAPSAAWSQVFLGEGFDPVDGASRLAILGRARNSLFASIESGGQVVAVGSASLAHGWCGIHGMRTLPAWRGQGLASGILAALAQAARARGLERAFLQVEAANAGAQALYRQAGFETRWRYHYWR